MKEHKEDKSLHIQKLYINELLNRCNDPNMDDKKLEETAKKFLNQIVDIEEERREKEREFDRSILPKTGQELVRNDRVVLKAISESEQDNYIRVSYECATLKKFYKDETFVRNVWSDFISAEVINYSIYDLQSGAYIGYCGIKNIYSEIWEIVIELMQKHQHKGYGSSALKLMLKALNEITGVEEFKSYVEIDNYASQTLMKKIGGVPDGIKEMYFHGEDLTLLQNGHEDKIDDRLKSVAQEFDVEPKKLIGCVLKYSISVKKI